MYDLEEVIHRRLFKVKPNGRYVEMQGEENLLKGEEKSLSVAYISV